MLFVPLLTKINILSKINSELISEYNTAESNDHNLQLPVSVVF